MFDESRLLAFIRALYLYEKGGCDTCTEYDGYGCSHPGNCEWHWDYAEDLKEFEIPEEVVTMELKKAIEILDGCIPHPSNKMVDREHLDIAIAWSVIKAELVKKPEEPEGCDFCSNYDFGRVGIVECFGRKEIALRGGACDFGEGSFKRCPVCGKKLESGTGEQK